jgi:hypothetical protein
MTVTSAESASEPAQPRRLLKKRNTFVRSPPPVGLKPPAQVTGT